MFFGNKKNDILIESLTNEILELKNRLEDKDNELKNLANSSSLKLENIIKNKDEEIELYKTISAFSQEEGVVVLDKEDKVFFVNDLSKYANYNNDQKEQIEYSLAIIIYELIKFILDKKEAKDDEAVYLDEQRRVNLSFEEIKKEVLKKI